MIMDTEYQVIEASSVLDRDGGVPDLSPQSSRGNDLVVLAADSLEVVHAETSGAGAGSPLGTSGTLTPSRSRGHGRGCWTRSSREDAY